MVRNLLLSAAFLAASALPSHADMIEGNWKTESGETAAITSCGGGFCITLKTGKHAGKKIASMAGAGGTYKGQLTDPADNKTYKGTARVSGKRLKLQGCVVWPVCKNQNWSKL